MAERKGFEPLRRLPAYTLSRRAPSTTRPSLRASVRVRARPLASAGQYTHGRQDRKPRVEGIVAAAGRLVSYGVAMQKGPVRGRSSFPLGEPELVECGLF